MAFPLRPWTVPTCCGGCPRGRGEVVASSSPRKRRSARREGRSASTGAGKGRQPPGPPCAPACCSSGFGAGSRDRRAVSRLGRWHHQVPSCSSPSHWPCSSCVRYRGGNEGAQSGSSGRHDLKVCMCARHPSGSVTSLVPGAAWDKFVQAPGLVASRAACAAPVHATGVCGCRWKSIRTLPTE